MISIILAVYNVKDYVESCIKSVLNSTYCDYELILVDDGSTDGSGEICDQFAQRDERFRVIHKTNGGLSDARNAGLDCAKGEYISFIDGDDIIHPRMLEALKQAIDSGDYDFSMMHYVMVDDDQREAIQFDEQASPSGGFSVMSQADYMNRLLDSSLNRLKYNFVWNKLYKKSLIEGMRFKPTVIEDMEWNFRVCMRMGKAIVINDKLYYWIQRGTSLTHGGINERYVKRIESYYLCERSIPREKAAYKARSLDLLYKVMVYTLYDTKKKGDEELIKKCKAIRSQVYKETKNDFLGSEMGKSRKMLLYALYNFPFLTPIFKMAFEMKSKLLL